jgi:hypothetical protein
LFLAFPAILCASVTLVESHERRKKSEHNLAGHRRGTEAAGLETAGADLGKRSRDVLNEHALKVFEAVQRSIAEIDEIILGVSDDQISANQQQLHERLKRMVEGSPEVKSFWIFDRNGRALVDSLTSHIRPRRSTIRTETISRLTSIATSARLSARFCGLGPPTAELRFSGLVAADFRSTVASTGSFRHLSCRSISKDSMPRSARRLEVISPSFVTTR